MLRLDAVEAESELLSDVRLENGVAEEVEARVEVNAEERAEEDESLDVALDVSCGRVLDTELPEGLWFELRETDTEIELLCTPSQVPKPNWQPKDALQWPAVFPHQL